jgi:hypothetical protein
MRFAIMLAFVSFVGIPVFFSAKRHANLFNQSKICYATDVLVLFLLVLNILLLALPEIELVTGMAGTSDRTIYVSFAPKYSDVLNVIGNPLFDIPRILFNYAGIGYFSGMLTAAYYGSLAATLFSVALSTLVGRQAAFAAAFCITTSKYFLIIVFLGANIITSLLVISVGTSLLFWIAPALISRQPLPRLILAGFLLGLFSVGLLFGYAASRLPALALCTVTAMCLAAGLLKHSYSWLGRASVFLATLVVPCLFLSLVYQGSVQRFQRDFFASTLPHLDTILPQRPSSVPSNVIGLSPDLPFVYGFANVPFEKAPGEFEIRGFIWKRSPSEALKVASVHAQNIFELYTWFPGGIEMWLTMGCGLVAMLAIRATRAARLILFVMVCALGVVLVLPFFIVTSAVDWRRGCNVLLLFCGLGGVGVYTLLGLLFNRVSPTRIALTAGLLYTCLSARASLASINSTHAYSFGIQQVCQYNPTRAILQSGITTRARSLYLAYMATGDRKACTESLVEGLKIRLGWEHISSLPISREASVDQIVSQVPTGATVAITCGSLGGGDHKRLCDEIIHDSRARLIHELRDKSQNLWLMEN